MMRSRRDFLGKLGMSAALAPFVPYLNSRAEAQPSSAHPVRLLILFNPNGSVPSRASGTGRENSGALMRPPP